MSAHLTHISAPDGVAPGTGYAQVVLGSGRLVAVSGQVAFDATGRLVGSGDAFAQARQAFDNIRRCLAAAGATFNDVMKLTYYVTDIEYLPAVRAARDEFVDVDYPPASTAVQIASLYKPGLLLEIDAWALVQPGAGDPSARR
jgi:enamine deaminase RidA (YjgF/YER057c/UK114 family)